MTTVSKPVAASAVTLREAVDFFADDILGSRQTQEDNCLFRANRHGIGLLAVLADGMGGYENGALASKLAVETFDQTYSSYPSDSVLTKLGASLQEANHALARAIEKDAHLKDMGCTLVGAFLNADGLHWISVGDSPLFLWRDNEVRRLNADHSMTAVIQERVAQGALTAEEAAVHPGRHELRSALTGEKLSLIDAPEAPFALRAEDVVILASDGLLTLSEQDLSRVLRQTQGKGAATIVRALLAAVKKENKPRQDNTTVQVIVAPVSLGKQRRHGSSTRRGLAWFVGCVLALAAVAGAVWKHEGRPPNGTPAHPIARPASVPKPVKLPEDPANALPDASTTAPPKPTGGDSKVKNPERGSSETKTTPTHSVDSDSAAAPSGGALNLPMTALPRDASAEGETQRGETPTKPAEKRVHGRTPATPKKSLHGSDNPTQGPTAVAYPPVGSPPPAAGPNPAGSAAGPPQGAI
jgi:protein phosphatase